MQFFRENVLSNKISNYTPTISMFIADQQLKNVNLTESVL